MKTKMIFEITDKKEFYIQGKSGLIYRIAEGNGSALDDEDERYVDYIYYDIYDTLSDLRSDNVYDGGCVLLTRFYQDLTIREILDLVGDLAGDDFEIEE